MSKSPSGSKCLNKTFLLSIGKILQSICYSKDLYQRKTGYVSSEERLSDSKSEVINQAVTGEKGVINDRRIRKNEKAHTHHYYHYSTTLKYLGNELFLI